MKKPQILFLAILSLAALAAVAEAGLAGGWNTIDPEHLKDQDVMEAAKFAVEQHNKKAGEKLKLVSVDSGKYQVVRGKNYKLVLNVEGAGNADVMYKYEAVVWVQPGVGQPKTLTSFKKQNP